MKNEHWIAAFRRVRKFRSDKGMTFPELQAATGLPETRLRDNLLALDSAGKLKVGWRETKSITGKHIKKPVYQLVEKRK